ncbi:uncharacterized protein LOC126745164 [Anthonomus grandis grandis]|uniref:uncharacterized protein LOC126745164 n=1 Tax=Anthonomus grandis grandis TaxID=2921223 RepID=UPI002165795A|nr:uncharacterized protein LOC126745164 [Anthonomus grandis grandis]
MPENIASHCRRDRSSRHKTLPNSSVCFSSIWREIAGIIKRSAQDCKTRWRTLRDLYNRKQKLITKKLTSTAASSKRSTWEYLSRMLFLRKVPHEKASFTNVSGTGSPTSDGLYENDQDKENEETVIDETEQEEHEEKEDNNTKKRYFEESEIPKKSANKK